LFRFDWFIRQVGKFIRRGATIRASPEAAELLVQWERDFVGWWTANVGVRESPGRSKSRADLRSILSMEKAEAETGITHQQVSRWRNGLRRPDYAAGNSEGGGGIRARADNLFCARWWAFGSGRQ
jgi:hypothetical protein